MAISRTPRNQQNENEFEFQTPTAQIFEDVDNEANGGKKLDEPDDKYDALAKQLSEMQERLTQSERANMALLTQPAHNASQISFVELDPSKVELPDPALDPNGYDAAITRRNEIREQNRTGRANFESKRKEEFTNKVENLWDNFSDQYEAYAVDKEKVDFVATQVVKAAQKRGLDVERYMFGTQDKYMADVVKKYNEVFGEPEAEEEDDDYNPRPRRASPRDNPRPRARARNRQEDERDVSRTGGIFGGNESGGRASGRRGETEDDGPNMIDDIQAIQKRTGFF